MRYRLVAAALLSALAVSWWGAGAAAGPRGGDEFAALVAKLSGEKPQFAKRQQDLLNARYDMADRPAPGVVMSRGKPVQDGVRVKLPEGQTWEKLAEMTPEAIKEQKLWP